MIRVGRAPLAVALLLGAAAPARPWGCAAHRIVALVAWAELSPATRERAATILAADPVSTQRRGCETHSRNPLADVAMWADAVRNDEPDTAAWHYIDVPRGATRAEVSRHCPSGRCVTAAITRQARVLASLGAPPAERARALRFVVHLVADLHQPLHATTNGDRGGNCLPVSYLGARPRPLEDGARWSPNLHEVWDTRLITTLLARDAQTTSTRAAALRRRFARDLARWKVEPVRLDDWAWETHEAGVETAYGRLGVRVPEASVERVASCRDEDVGRRLARLGARVDDTYVAAVAPVLDGALARAGARLAHLLEGALGR